MVTKWRYTCHLTLEAQLRSTYTDDVDKQHLCRQRHGDPIIVPSQDVVLGLYYITRDAINAKGEGMVFADTHEVNRALATGQVDLHARVKARVHQTVIDENGNREHQTIVVDTTPGRCLLWEVVPEGMDFQQINVEMTKKNISKLINSCYRKLGLKDTVIFADQLMYFGLPSSNTFRCFCGYGRHVDSTTKTSNYRKSRS